MKRIFYLVLALLISVNYCYATPDQTISTPKSFTANTTAQSGEVNQNFNEVSSKFNAHSHTDITSLGTVTTGLWNATVVDEQYGGIGSNFASATQGNLLYFSGTGTIASLPPGGNDKYLKSGGPTANPSWSDVTPSATNSILQLNTSVIATDTGSNGAINIVADGTTMQTINVTAITSTIQPCFLVNASGAQTNIASGSAITIIWQNEITDQGGDFVTNTFTAPVDGNYLLAVTGQMDECDTAAASYVLTLTTSNRNYGINLDPDIVLTADGAIFFAMSYVADMDASDTVIVTINQGAGGGVQADVGAGFYFSGSLLN